MKLRGILLAMCVPSVVHAGGLFLPGSGAVSSSRAGAAVASADDGEALALNPAGIAKASGTTITISAAMIDYFMQFTRAGSYDQLSETDTAYEGQAYGTVKNQAKPPLGFGGVQPVPVIAIISDLGGVVPGLHVAAGVFAPNAYPFRDMTGGYQFGVSGDDVAPPPTRYDIMKQEAAVILPSVAVAYHVNKMLDVGARFSAGIANLKSTTVLWGMPQNFDEYVGKDGIFTVDAKDSFVPVFAVGALFRPTDNLEFGVNWESEASIQAKGTAVSANGKDVTLNGTPIVIKPPDDAGARCAPGGSEAELKACVGLSLPMNAQIGGRYKWLDSAGEEKADLEVNLDWEHWGKTCATTNGVQNDLGCTSPTNYRVTVDGTIFLRPGGGQPDQDASLGLKDSVVSHGLQDTYGVRIGGSYRIPLDERHENSIILRGGVGYDTAAATSGWLRTDLDGASRTTLTAGAAYKTKRYRIDVGGGVILEGSQTNPNLLPGNQVCNPTGMGATVGCADGGASATPVAGRHGPDPINPLLDPSVQAENPVTQGVYQGHYLMFMLGFTTWF